MFLVTQIRDVFRCILAVFDIMLDVANAGNWQASFKTHIPERFKIAYKEERTKKKIATAMGIPVGDVGAGNNQTTSENSSSTQKLQPSASENIANDSMNV
jgi:hypothetical protein